MHLEITNQIYLYGKKQRLFFFWKNLSLFILLLLVIWLSITLADSVFYFSQITRWGLLIINFPVIGYFFYKFVFVPFKNWIRFSKNSNLSSIAREIGAYDPEISDHLVNVYQLSQQPSSSFVRAAIEQISSTIKNKTFSERINPRSYLPKNMISVSVIFSLAVLSFFQYSNLIHSTLRLINPLNDYLIVPEYNFKVTPGNLDLLYGQPLQITAQYSGPEIEYVEVYLINPQKENSKRILRMDKKNDTYVVRIKEVNASLQYFLSAIPLKGGGLEGKLVSGEFTVNVQVPPQVKDLALKVTPPTYSGTGQELISNAGNINALSGSRVNFKITSNKVLQNARLVFGSNDSLLLSVKGKLASGTLHIKENDSYKIVLKDTENLINQNPIVYTINILPDNAPYVDISEPGKDIEAQLEDILSLKIDAADDYGLSNVYVLYRYLKQNKSSDSTWHTFNLKDFKPGSKKYELKDYFDFSDFYIGYDDQMEYYAVAIDNNTVKGFSRGQSPFYRIRFPSLNELFEEFSEKEENNISQMEDIAKDSQKLKEKLEEINRDLKRTNKMDWEQKKEIDNTLEKQKDALEKLEKIQNELSEMIDKLDKNNLMNPEILEKYSQLQELFREIATPEVLEAMQKLQEAMEKSDPNDVKSALENFKQNQEAFQANLERVMELFKQVQLEQQIDQLIQQAERLSENQEKISKEIDKDTELSAEKSEQLSSEQEQQKEQLSSLKRSLEKVLTKEQLEKFTQALEKLKEANMQVNDPGLQNQMGEMQKNLQEQNKSQAAQNSQKMQKSFQSIEQNLSQAMQNLQQQHKNEVQGKMVSAIQKILTLSYQQEDIQNQTKDASTVNDDIRRLARQQAEVQNNLGKLLSDIISLSKETFFLNPDLSKSMANAYNSMQKSLDDLSERLTAQASSEQIRSMAALNQTAGSLQNSLSQMSSSQSGTGFEQFMEQLQKMGNAQGSLNEDSMNMFNQGNGGQMSMQQQAESRRLAARQQAIQQALKEMTQQSGNRSDVLGRLGEMGEQMEEVIQDLLSAKMNRQTIERQQQILSRMLDAQKSVKEREYSKKRKAEQAKNYAVKDPGSIKDFENARYKQLQDALKKALSEGYYDDYQKLIEAYFKTLSSSPASQ